MSNDPTPAPAPARMVSVDAELLMRLSGHAQALSYTDTTHGQRGTAAKDAELALAALTTPAPQPSAPAPVGKVEVLIGNLEAWPEVYRMGTHDTQVCQKAARLLRNFATAPAPADAGLRAGLVAERDALLKEAERLEQIAGRTRDDDVWSDAQGHRFTADRLSALLATPTPPAEPAAATAEADE